MSGFRIKRAYEAASEKDGQRILVDRLWPRGLSREQAKLDGWAKDVAPSTELRKWFHADPEGRRAEFDERYADELSGSTQRQAISDLQASAAKETVTLLTAVKDAEHSYLTVLLEQLKSKP